MNTIIFLVVASVSVSIASPHNLDGRIVGGYNVDDVRKPPSMCGLLLRKGNDGSWCGCTIIDNRYAVTAAHCCDGADEAYVFLGAAKKQDGDRLDIPGSNIIQHESFTNGSTKNDICIIKFPQSVKFSPLVNKVEIGCAKEGQVCKTVGWGKQADNATKQEEELQGAHLKILPRSHCSFWGVNESQLCLDTSHGQSTCKGDSGGPLYCNGKVSGCTSFGGKSCEKGFPVVFTNLCAFLDWINAKTGLKLKSK